MSKVIMRLLLPEAKVRKHAIKAVQKHRDKTKYTRKCKHKATEIGGLMFLQIYLFFQFQKMIGIYPHHLPALGQGQ